LSLHRYQNHKIAIITTTVATTTITAATGRFNDGFRDVRLLGLAGSVLFPPFVHERIHMGLEQVLTGRMPDRHPTNSIKALKEEYFIEDIPI